MPDHNPRSEWRSADPQQRAEAFLQLDQDDRLEVVKDLSSTECGKLLDEMKSVEAQLVFLACMEFDQGISTLASASNGTRATIIEAISSPNLQETINRGVEECVSQKGTSVEAIIHELTRSGLDENGRKPAKGIFFTDIGEDIDDPTLLIIVAYLHRINVMQILLVVCNVKPTEWRARRAKFILESMGCPDVPVACGTDGTDNRIELYDYEVKAPGESRGEILKDGERAIVKTLNVLKENSERCNLIIGSSLRDLSELVKKHKPLVEMTVSSLYLQGMWDTVDAHVKALVPDMKAKNNSYDCDATTHVYEWLRQSTLSTYTSTRFSAVKVEVDSEVIREAAEKGHPAAQYLYHCFQGQERKYHDDSIDPARRHMEHQDLPWYCGRQPKWLKKYGDKLPKNFEEIQPYVGLTLYDVVAGLLCPLQEYDFVGQIYHPHHQDVLVGEQHVRHYIIGRPADKAGNPCPDVNVDLLSGLIVQLLENGLSEIGST